MVGVSVNDGADLEAVDGFAQTRAAQERENFQRLAFDRLPEDPSKPLGQKYGYGITQMRFGPNSLYFHGGGFWQALEEVRPQRLIALK